MTATPPSTWMPRCGKLPGRCIPDPSPARSHCWPQAGPGCTMRQCGLRAPFGRGDSREPKGVAMIEPYQALGLVPTMRGIRSRDEIAVNLGHLSHLIKAASWLSSLDLPVRLIAVPEG